MLSLALAPNALAFTSPSVRENPGARKPILVALELSGGNDGLNTVVPFRNDDYTTGCGQHLAFPPKTFCAWTQNLVSIRVL